MTRNAKIALAVLFGVLIADQCLKIYIKTHFMLGEEVHVFGDWFKLHFVENNGMAFGMEIGGGSDIGKLFLSIFRIVAVGVISWYLYRLCKTEGRTGLVVCVALVLAGASGNIIDSVFYGALFSSSWGQIAEFLPASGGYAPWLQGRVVDMLYFPILEGRYPDWFPLCGGESFIFFRPVFNIADAAISVGIIALILFQRNELSNDLSNNNSQDSKA